MRRAINEWLTQQGRTQRELAHRLGVSTATVSNIINQPGYLLTGPMLKCLQDIIGLSPEPAAELREASEPYAAWPADVSPEARELANLCDWLSPERRTRLIRLSHHLRDDQIATSRKH